jgi:hypothetical protein
MKIEEIPSGYKACVEFTCKTCRAYHKSTTGKSVNCVWRKYGEVCTDIQTALSECMAETDELELLCDSCGKFPKQPNSMLCKECETKANDN